VGQVCVEAVLVAEGVVEHLGEEAVLVGHMDKIEYNKGGEAKLVEQMHMDHMEYNMGGEAVELEHLVGFGV
jgi:hypothetical protein